MQSAQEPQWLLSWDKKGMLVPLIHKAAVVAITRVGYPGVDTVIARCWWGSLQAGLEEMAVEASRRAMFPSSQHHVADALVVVPQRPRSAGLLTSWPVRWQDKLGQWAVMSEPRSEWMAAGTLRFSSPLTFPRVTSHLPSSGWTLPFQVWMGSAPLASMEHLGVCPHKSTFRQDGDVGMLMHLPRGIFCYTSPEFQHIPSGHFKKGLMSVAIKDRVLCGHTLSWNLD